MVSYVDATQLYLSFPQDQPSVLDMSLNCLLDMSAWMQDHHLTFNLAKSEVLVVPAKQSIHHGDIKTCLSLSRLSNHVASVSQLCCLGKKSDPTQHAAQLPCTIHDVLPHPLLQCPSNGCADVCRDLDIVIVINYH